MMNPVRFEHMKHGLGFMRNHAAQWLSPVGAFLSEPINVGSILLGILLGAFLEEHLRERAALRRFSSRIADLRDEVDPAVDDDRPVLDLTPWTQAPPPIEPRAAHPDARPVAFADREYDLAPMTILVEPDGTVVARRRLAEDRIRPDARTGAFDDVWVHVGSGGRYTRHDVVWDLETGTACHDYSSWSDGRLWLRSIAEWFEMRSDGRPRFQRVEQFLGADA